MFRSTNRAFTLVAVLTLALGIGANAAIFSVLEAVLLRPLPYPHPERIVRLTGQHPQQFMLFSVGISVSPEALRHSSVFDAIGLAVSGGLNLDETPSERLRAATASPEFFDVLGVPPLLGRFFTSKDGADARLAVISDSLWRRRFGSDPAVVGRSIVLNGQHYSVIGVASRESMYPEATDVWIPTGADDQILGAVPTPHVLARLAPNTTLAQARQQVAQIVFAPQPVTPERLQTIHVISFRDELVGSLRPIAILVALAAGLILLVACINVANLLLVRMAARERELTIRRALGASPSRIVRDLLVESLLLAMLAGMLAIPAAAWTLPLLRQLMPAGLHGVDHIAIDRGVVLITAGLSLLTTILFGLAPALSLGRAPLANPLRGAATTTASRAWRIFRSALVVAETAIALLILAGAAAIVSNVSHLSAADIGARRAGTLTFVVTVPAARYDSNEKVARFIDRVITEIHGVAGVEAVAATSELPGDAAEATLGRRVRVDGLPPPAVASSRFAVLSIVSPEYFASLGIPVLAGRAFTPADRPGADAVAIVSQGYARAVGLTPAAMVGRRVLLEGGPSSFAGGRGRPERWARAIGVVGDVKLRGPEGQFVTAIYDPFAVAPPRFAPIHLTVATIGTPESLAPALRAAMARIDPAVPLSDLRTFGDVQGQYVAGRRFAMRVVLAFGALAIILTGIGLFSVIAYLVQLRTREIGIRMAVGATQARIGGSVLLNGLAHAAAGVAAGLGGFAIAARIVAAKVPNFWTIDAAGCAFAVVFVTIVAMAAAWVPARRAARVDPLVALRAE